MSRQYKPVYNNNDLSIFYMGTDEDFVDQELNSFRLGLSTNDDLHVSYPALGEYSAHYDFNTIELKEDKETQRYILTMSEIIDNEDKTVTEIIKQKEFYPMAQYDLRVRFKRQQEKER